MDRDALVAVLCDEGARYGCALEACELASLDYALAAIRPSTHVEAAVCVRCARPYPTSDLVDEYLRRQRGDPPELPDHLALSLANWGLPETRRMLFFREQIEALFSELTGLGREAALRLHDRIWRRRAGLDELHAALGERWRGLGACELQTIFAAIQRYQGGAQRYAWCSACVDHAQVVWRDR